MDVCWEQERKKYIFATTISFLPWCLSKFLDFQCFIYFFSKMRLIKPSSKLRRVVACFYRALSKPKILQRVRKHLITFRFRKTLIFNYSVVWYATINFLSLEADHLYIFTLRSVGFSRSYFFFHLTETLRSPWVEAVFLCGKFCYISPVCLSFNSKIKPL